MLATPRILVAIAAGVATVAAKRYLPPGPINAGYVGGECNETQIMHAVQTGLNVLFWFSINLVDRGGAPAVQGGPNVTCVRSVMATLASRGLNTTHMISVGGWNAPHPTTRFPAAAVYAAWAKWNAALAPGGLYDGVDWDLEGNDDVASPYNTFAAPVLDLVGQFSQLAQADGFVVTLVPPESYLDPVTAPTYNRSLLFDYPDGWQPAFKYHGRNAYALLLAKYGTTTTPTAAVPTFDLVMIQVRGGGGSAETPLHRDLRRGHSSPQSLASTPILIATHNPAPARVPSTSCTSPTATRTSTSRRGGRRWRTTSNRGCPPLRPVGF